MDLAKVIVGKNVPEEVNVLIEIPQGSAIKYELDKKSGFIFVDRFVHTAMTYPFNYGFIPHTKAEDDDPIDVMVISNYPVMSGSVIPARPIGMLEMEDEAGIDTKIIALPTKKVDPFYSNVEDVSALPGKLREMIKHFFDHYKELETNKWVKTKNFLSAEEAKKAIKKSLI